MKKSGILAASMAAASATAFSASSSSTSSKDHIPHEDVVSCKIGGKSASKKAASTSSEKFAPRFDGLRFIETLVTAHR